MNTPQIYVVCLAAYNNGNTHGAWIDCNQDVESIYKDINKMLSASPAAKFSPCEEWAIHDSQNWHGMKIDEHECLQDLALLAEKIAEYGPAATAYYQEYSTLEDFEDYYRGEYESEKDFVESQLRETGVISAVEKLGILESYIDYEVMADNWFVNDYVSFRVGWKVHVFSRH